MTPVDLAIAMAAIIYLVALATLMGIDRPWLTKYILPLLLFLPFSYLFIIASKEGSFIIPLIVVFAYFGWLMMCEIMEAKERMEVKKRQSK